jgi:hypothetical protein
MSNEPVAYLGPRELLAIVRRCALEGACRMDETEAAWARWRVAQAEAEEKLERWKECLRLSQAAARIARTVGEEQHFRGEVYESAAAGAAVAHAGAKTMERIYARAAVRARVLRNEHQRLAAKNAA